MIALGACASVIAAVWLHMIVSLEIGGGRREYQTIVPFLIGLGIAIPVCIWPIRRFLGGWKRLLVRSAVCTLLLAPVPYGPEGTMLPLIVTLIFPPLVFLVLFPGRIALAFCFFVGFFSVLSGSAALLFPAHSADRSIT
jgi:hypothetical protein